MKIELKDLILDIENSVANLSQEELAKINLNGKNKENFKLNLGQKCAIQGLFSAIEKMITSSSINPTMEREPHQQTLITAANIQDIVNKVLKPKVKSFCNVTIEDFPIVRRATQTFPMKLEVACFKCQKSISISAYKEQKNMKNYFTLRHDKYINHVRACVENQMQ
jgi:hypothetical protein